MEAAGSQPGKGSARSIGGFLGLTCLLSWPIWLASGVLPRGGTGAYDARWLVAQIGVFGPSLAALVVSAASGRDLRRNSLRMLPCIQLPLLVPGVLIARASPPGSTALPPAAAVASVVVGALVVAFFSPLNRRLLGPATGRPQPRPGGGWIFLSVALLPALFLAAWVIADAGRGRLEITGLRGGALGASWILLVCFAHNLLLGGPLGEEIGWRGFLLPELIGRMGPLAASLALGVVWGLWHLPIDLYAGFGATGPGAVMARVIYALPVSILFTWIYLRSGGSILCALLLHASLNVMGDLGLSGYEATGMVFFAMVTVAALVVAVRSPVFRGTGAA